MTVTGSVFKGNKPVSGPLIYLKSDVAGAPTDSEFVTLGVQSVIDGILTWNTVEKVMYMRTGGAHVPIYPKVATKAGVPVDADFGSPTDGMVVLDTNNQVLYQRSNGVWVGTPTESTYSIYKVASTWYCRGAINDNSSGDSPTTDPVPLINRIIAMMNQGEKLIVRGDFTSSITLKWLTTNSIIYEHYGIHTYSGTGDAVLFQSVRTDTYKALGGRFYIYKLIGPNTVSPYNANANAFGIRAVVIQEWKIEVGEIEFFTEAVRIDASNPSGVTSVVADNDWYFHADFNNIIMHCFGTTSNFCQGNNWAEGACGSFITDGVLVDNNSGGFGYLRIGSVTIDNGGNGAPGYVSNVASTTQPGTFFNNTKFLQQDLAIFGPNDFGTIQGANATVSVYRVQMRLPNRQLGVSFTAVTSKAVTFPTAETDTGYSIVPTFSVNVGGWWITAKTTTGCTINWVTSSTGTLDYFVYR